MADYMRLRQVISNLVSNAIKFTHDGKVTIRIKNPVKTKDYALLRFEVEDTGIGIAKDKQEYIFEKFTQVDNSSTRKFGGIGLGLSICKTLIKMMGGSIGVESQVGVGSTFWIEIQLPIHYENTSDTKKNNSRSGLPQFNATLLVAEDIPDNSYVLQEMLEQMGCSVLIANNGAEAIKLGEENQSKFDIILMDCQMPKIDGYAATKIIREKTWGKEIPIIAVTANALNDDRKKCLDAGMTDYVAKPLRFTDLQRILGKYITAQK